MGWFKEARAGHQLTVDLIALTPGHSGTAVKRYSNKCDRLARKLRPATWGDLMTLTVAVLREIDRTGGYEDAFHAVSEGFNSRQLTGPTGIPVRQVMSPEDAAQIMSAAAETFRAGVYRQFQQTESPTPGGHDRDDR